MPQSSTDMSMSLCYLPATHCFVASCYLSQFSVRIMIRPHHDVGNIPQSEGIGDIGDIKDENHAMVRTRRGPCLPLQHSARMLTKHWLRRQNPQARGWIWHSRTRSIPTCFLPTSVPAEQLRSTVSKALSSRREMWPTPYFTSRTDR